MSPKSSTAFVCQNCETSYSKWQGQCDACGEWNTLLESMVAPSKAGKTGKRSAGVDRAKLLRFDEVVGEATAPRRFGSGMAELDRVLGGGIVPGAVMLVGGEPGIGKSTLLTQVVLQLLNDGGTESTTRPLLYVCGEESPNQISLRINRFLENEHKASKSSSGQLGAKIGLEQLVFNTSTDVDEVVSSIEELRPRLVIVDSIQTMSTQDLTGAAASAGQIRESADRLTRVAKALHVPMFLVGHVTKDGVIAGPKVLEHIVDSVLELSGERTDDVRLLRAVKNRFGATDEVGVFRVVEYGLEEVSNPSQLFLEHQDTKVPGSAVVCIMEGTRPLMLEVQSLVIASQLAMPRRVGRGIELSRIQVLSAILQKHCGLPLGSSDVFLSAAGGFKVTEPAVDLGLAVAMASSLVDRPLPPKTIFVGEVGLLGEVRSVNYLERRIKEAKRLGFTTVVSRQTHPTVKKVLQEFKLLRRS